MDVLIQANKILLSLKPMVHLRLKSFKWVINIYNKSFNALFFVLGHLFSAAEPLRCPWRRMRPAHGGKLSSLTLLKPVTSWCHMAAANFTCTRLCNPLQSRPLPVKEKKGLCSWQYSVLLWRCSSMWPSVSATGRATLKRTAGGGAS